MKQLFLAQPVIAEIIAMIRRKDDHGLVHPSTVLKPIEKLPEVIVVLLNEDHICRHRSFADTLLGKGLPDAHSH